MMKTLAAFGIILLMASAALAHEPRPGPNGGLLVDAGSFHAELVADGTETVTLFLFDADDKPVESAGFAANAILIANGKPVRFSLEPAGGQKMTGKAPSAIEPGARGAVQLTMPDGSTAQAKY
jgi:hypothetical protein